MDHAEVRESLLAIRNTLDDARDAIQRECDILNNVDLAHPGAIRSLSIRVADATSDLDFSLAEQLEEFAQVIEATCADCGNPKDDCTCDTCADCGAFDCVCEEEDAEACPECGEHGSNCTCAPVLGLTEPEQDDDKDDDKLDLGDPSWKST